MSVRDPRLWTAILSVALVVLLVVWDTARPAPGPLSAVHAQVPGLTAAGSCDTCHGGWFRSMDRACEACHELVASQLETGRGLHGSFGIAGERSACARCHSEHHGAGFEPAGEVSFLQAGLGARAQFDHAHVEFGLVGRHAELGCAACHPNAEVEVPAPGEHRFAGLTQDCAACHEDPHGGRFARSCESCHGQELSFARAASFVHTEDFPLRGGHALGDGGAGSCQACHPSGGPYAIEALAGFEPPPPARGCADCHDDSPHRPDFVAGAAALAGAEPAASCAACHDAEHGTFAGDGTSLPGALHAASGFALEPPHAGLDCEACHGAEGDFAARYPGRAADACQACHDDPHAGQFGGGPFERAGCLACHRESGFVPTAFDLELHGRARFALEGSHRAVACAACHPPAAQGGGRRFSGTPADCDACHQDPHAGTAGGSIAELACDACHATDTFSATRADSFDHAVHAGFELAGAHASAACEACHPPAGPGGGGRAFGRARSVACAGCHASVHGEFFAGLDCARCHRTESFGPVEGFEHGAATGFELTGAHARASCESCHGVYPDAELAGRRLGRVAQLIEGPRERCESCHADPHAGAFERAAPGDVGCARCHSTDSFEQVAGFDHGRWTGHALEGAHAALDCAACHPPLPALDGAGGVPRGFARAAGTACGDCHADPHRGQFREGDEGPADCARCHHQEHSFELSAFDHQRQTRFPLDEAHARLECSACHRPWPLPEGGAVVRYKPLGTACVDCHDHGGGRER